MVRVQVMVTVQVRVRVMVRVQVRVRVISVVWTSVLEFNLYFELDYSWFNKSAYMG